MTAEMKKTTFRLTAELKEQVEAKLEGKSLNTLLTELVTAWLDSDGTVQETVTTPNPTPVENYMKVDTTDDEDDDLPYDPREWGKNNPYKLTKIGGFDIE
jgi:hypothetical protein